MALLREPSTFGRGVDILFILCVGIIGMMGRPGGGMMGPGGGMMGGMGGRRPGGGGAGGKMALGAGAGLLGGMALGGVGRLVSSFFSTFLRNIRRSG